MEHPSSYCSVCDAPRNSKYRFCPACGTDCAAESARGDGYRPTVFAESGGQRRRLLLLGAAALLTTAAGAGTIVSIFNKPLDLAGIETGDPFVFVAALEPAPLDPADENAASDRPAGGGGGGRNDSAPAQKGRTATQTDDPLFSPSKDYVALTDPAIKIRAATKGPKKTPPDDLPYGLVGGGFTPSDGPGCCGGQGNGPGRGQGRDPGDGLGPGKNGGPGGPGGELNGGRPQADEDAPVPVVKKAVTEPLKILSKPRANYTDRARETLVEGRVVLRVTFLASGSIGNIVTVSGLPGGLTEQAIAAARQIRFEPAKVNGVAVSVTRTIEYTFAIF